MFHFEGMVAFRIVNNAWGLNGTDSGFLMRVAWINYMMQQKNIVNVIIENRTVGGRGKKYKDMGYGDISKWIVHDQIEAAKHFSSLSWSNGKNLFWGWSGGGYAALHLSCRAHEHYHAIVSVAPVSSWRNYDSIYTERYMNLLDNNQEGYKKADANLYAPNMMSNLLVITGSGDDNVHQGNSIQFIDKLIENNVQFDMMIYPNK